MIKYKDYHAEAARRDAFLLSSIVDSIGSFTPADKLFNPGISNRRVPRGVDIDPRLAAWQVQCVGVAGQRGLMANCYHSYCGWLWVGIGLIRVVRVRASGNVPTKPTGGPVAVHA